MLTTAMAFFMHDAMDQLIEIDVPSRSLRRGDEIVRFTRSEFSLMLWLINRPGQTFGRDALIAGIHGDDYPATPRSIDVQVVGVRRKLGDLAGQLETVRGRGYRFRSVPGVAWRVVGENHVDNRPPDDG